MTTSFRVSRVLRWGGRASSPSTAAAWRARRAIALLAGAAALLGAPAHAQQQARNAVAEVGELMWALVTNGESVPWTAAKEYCDTLEHAGFGDWRLPTLPELESLHDPSVESGLRAPFNLGDCCAWSSTNIVEVPPERKGALPDPSLAPANYYWGFLFAGGIRYYSYERFPDGTALCVRKPA
jgi:hypothetical protein